MIVCYEEKNVEGDKCKGLFTYDASQKWRGPDLASLPCQPKSEIGLSPLPPCQKKSETGLPPLPPCQKSDFNV